MARVLHAQLDAYQSRHVKRMALLELGGMALVLVLGFQLDDWPFFPALVLGGLAAMFWHGPGLLVSQFILGRMGRIERLTQSAVLGLALLRVALGVGLSWIAYSAAFIAAESGPGILVLSAIGHTAIAPLVSFGYLDAWHRLREEQAMHRSSRLGAGILRED